MRLPDFLCDRVKVSKGNGTDYEQPGFEVTIIENNMLKMTEYVIE